MAKSKDDIKYGTAHAKVTEDDSMRVAYVNGTPLEAGKIADSEPVDLFSSARNINIPSSKDAHQPQSQPQAYRDPPIDQNDNSRQSANPSSTGAGATST